MKSPPALVIVSFVLAGIAFLLPWVTHFADLGLSFLAHAGWIVMGVTAFVSHRKCALRVLLGAPYALFWPTVLV
jgi:hypothetical protein